MVVQTGQLPGFDDEPNVPSESIDEIRDKAARAGSEASKRRVEAPQAPRIRRDIEEPQPSAVDFRQAELEGQKKATREGLATLRQQLDAAPVAGAQTKNDTADSGPTYEEDPPGIRQAIDEHDAQVEAGEFADSRAGLEASGEESQVEEDNGSDHFHHGAEHA